MKKVISIFSITAFISSFAVAQQNDFFDIQKHLQEKFRKEQEEKQKEKILSLTKEPRLTFIKTQAPPLAKLSHTLPGNIKVYLLPLDNMPCVVPDMKKYHEMPNTASKNKLVLQNLLNRDMAGTIPNPAGPRQIIPDDNDNK